MRASIPEMVRYRMAGADGEMEGMADERLARLTGIVARLVGCAPVHIQVQDRAPLDHQSNRLYEAWADGRHLIVKEYLKPEEYATAPVYEYRALELLVPLDVAPRPVGIETKDDAVVPIVVYEDLEGEMWDRRRPSSTELAALAEVG